LLAATGHICYDLTNKIKEEQNMFGENLKTLRKEKGFSQEQLATRLNVVRQTISKWEKSVSVPDAETLIQLADVLEVEVSDLLGKKIEIEGEQSEMEALAAELAKLNELLVVYGNKASDLKKKIGALIVVVLFVLFVCAIFGTWTDMWHEFGQNLYHLLND
jgi:putative transcriptional regulator